MLSRGLRLALIAGISLGYIAWQGHSRDAFAKKGHSDDSGGDDDDDDSAGSDDSGDDSGNEEDPDADKDQPPVTAGGLYTLKTYPVRENSRPLTITQGMTQLRLGIGTDLSAKGAFGSAGISLEAQYGVKDNFMLVGGLTDAYNFNQYSAYFGFEGSLIYDLLDFRAVANLHRSAFSDYQNYCSPHVGGDPDDMLVKGTDGSLQSTLTDVTKCTGNMPTIVTLPNGTYEHGGTKFSIDIGFPFRYAFKPEIALVLLQTLISIDFNSTARDHVVPVQIDLGPDPNNPDGPDITTNRYQAVPNGAKPDLNLSAGLAANPIPQLSIVAFAAFKIPDFDTSAGNFQIPLTLRIEASASQQLDFGLEFTLLNLIPPDPQSPIDNRYLSAFVQARF